MSHISLRPVTPADDEFLFAVYASTRSTELALVPWDDAQKLAFLQMQITAQRKHYQEYYPSNEHLVILRGAEPVGRLWLDRQVERIHMLDVTVLPQFRGASIGGTVVRQLLDEAAGAGKAVTIYVEGFSPSLRFFERLGFASVEEKGAHLLLRWLE